MYKTLTFKFILILSILLGIDFLCLHLTTTSYSNISAHLSNRLNHPIEIIEQVKVNESEFILYHDLETNQLDIAWYEPNELLFWRYNFTGGHQASKNAHVNRCQTLQTQEYFILWGMNEQLKASTLEFSLNQEVFIEDLSQTPYFLKIYPFNGVIPPTVYCNFYNEQGDDISTYFFQYLEK